MQLEEAMTEFVADLQLAGRAAGTIHKHELEIARLGRWCVERGAQWHELDKRTLQVYVRERSRLGHSARSNMFCSLRTFYRWSVEQGYCASSPAAHFKTPIKPQPLPRALSMEQVKQLLEMLSSLAPTLRNQRDRVLLLILLYAGLRCREAAALRWADVDFKAGAIAIRISKGGKGRAVPLHAGLSDELGAWRIAQGLEGEGFVFGLDGRQLVPGRVGKVARAWSKHSGIKFSAHQLRHTFATFALRRSRDVYAVSKALGHSQLRQTEIYISADVEQIRHAIDSLPGTDSW